MYGKDDLAAIESTFKDAGYGEEAGYKVKYDNSQGKEPDIKIDKSEVKSWTTKWFSGGDTDYNIPVILFTPDNIFRNRIASFDINFIDPPSSGEKQQKTISAQLKETIATWYNALRMLALVRNVISTSICRY